MSKSITTQFDLYKVADDKVQACRAALDASMKERSLVVEQIVSDFGTGPFAFEGREIVAVTRKIKDDDDVVIGQTTFFKAARQKKPKVVVEKKMYQVGTPVQYKGETAIVSKVSLSKGPKVELVLEILRLSGEIKTVKISELED